MEPKYLLFEKTTMKGKTTMLKQLGTIMLLATVSGSCAALVFACFWLFDKRMYG